MSERIVRPGSNGYVSPVFVDASGWIGLTSQRDQHHRAARTLLAAFFARRVRVATTNWTVYEAVSTLKGREGIGAAERLWRLVADAASVELVFVNDEIERRALELFFGYRDKTWGVVDCASLVVMADLGCRQTIAFDRHVCGGEPAAGV